MAPKDNRTPEEIATEIATNDGNAFHARVATFFRNKGWTVQISPYYVDNASGQAREIDLLCEKHARIVQGSPRRSGSYHIQLFVECKYITGPVVFWFDACEQTRRNEWIRKNTPFKPSARARAGYLHRYLTDRGTYVAKLFRGGSDKGGESHEPIYKGLSQSLGALIQRRTAPLLTQLGSEFGEPFEVVRVQYPVIVCSDNAKFFHTNIGDDPPKAYELEPDLLLEVNYAYNVGERMAEEYFLIDVLQFGRLEQFLRRIEGELQESALARSD